MYTVNSSVNRTCAGKVQSVILKVSCEKMCFQCCLEDTDFCAGSDIVLEVYSRPLLRIQ